jgi:putative phosphoribosyl transferase
MPLYADRRAAGRALADELIQYAGRDDVVVLALPRGGVPVAYEVAQALGAPLDVFIVRKLGVPGREELAMGAIASGGVRVLNRDIVRGLAISDRTIDQVAETERRELQRRERLYRGDRDRVPIEGRVAILVDDGLATGASMRAAVQAAEAQNPAEIVVAVPVASRETCAEFERLVDAVVCAATPQPFMGVGLWYADFSQTTDEEVRELLEKARGGCVRCET